MAKATNRRELITNLCLIHLFTSVLCICAAKVIIVIIYIYIANTNEGHHASCPSPPGRMIDTGVECVEQRLPAAVSL